MIAFWFFFITFVVLIVWIWVSGNDKSTKTPPIMGDDFLNWDKMKKYENDLYK